MEARQGETPQAARCARQRDRLSPLAGDARTSVFDITAHGETGSTERGVHADPAQPFAL